MKPSTIYSKSGKGVQEASGKTSLLKRADRAVLSAIDGRATLGEVAEKVGKSFDAEFEKLIAQLDKDGFVREVAAAAASSSSQSRPAVPAVKPGAKAPAARTSSSSSGGADDLDFTTIMPAIKPAARPLAPAAAPSKAQVSDAALRAKEQESALYKARQEAEAKSQAERDRVKQEAETKARVEAEAKARLDAENRLREEAIGRAKAAAEAQVKAARAKLEAEARAKLDGERKVREEVERKVREESERSLREAEALRQRLEDERKARDEVERKRREEEERRRKEEEERRAREEAERRAREEAERKRREEEEEKKRRAEEERRVEEEARRLREEIEAKAREAAERARREEEDRLMREKEEQVRRAKAAEEARMLQARAMEEARLRVRQRERERDPDEPRGRSKSKDETKVAQPTLPAAAAPAAPGGGSLDALMADLDSFSQREEEERQGREVADRQAREEGKLKAQAEAERRAQEDAERQMREQLEREAREQEERQRRDEEERRAREEAERRSGVEEHRRLEAEEGRRLEAEERKRKAQEALLAKAAPLPDIEVSDKDLDMDEVRHDEAAVAREARKAQREREREARTRAKEAKEHAKAAAREQSVKYPKMRRKVNWGRPLGITLLTLLAAGLVALHIIPLPMDEYERAASDALGRPVKIGTGRLSLYSGLRLNLDNVSVDGATTIARARAYPQLRALIEGRQVLGRLEVSGVTVPQSAIGAVVGAKLRGDGFRGARVVAKDLRLTGPVALPVLDGEVRIGPDGAVNTVILSGPESLAATLTPTAKGEVEFDVTAATLTVPFAPEVTLSTFAMKGVANRQGMNIASWGGGVLDGAVSGAATLRWSGAWSLEGGLTARAINAAAFAPALLCEGKAEGQARFSMSGNDPAKLYHAAYLEGNFSVGKGMLGTVDLSRVLHTSGRQYGGRTQFTEMTGHATYDRGAVALRNVNLSAGALTAAASADVAPSGAISGRIVADIRTTVQPLRAILVIGGTVKEPQVRN
jgi:hypothetical protein